MQAMRYGHQESGRSSGASLTQEQEKMVKKVMLTMKDFDIQRGQQDCEATLRETNFDFDKAIDLLISPNYHPWISNPINKSLHRPSGHGDPILGDASTTTDGRIETSIKDSKPRSTLGPLMVRALLKR